MNEAPQKVDADEINLILEAIEQLDADKDFTAAGLPRLDALERVLGIAVTKEERQEALEIRETKR